MYQGLRYIGGVIDDNNDYIIHQEYEIKDKHFNKTFRIQINNKVGADVDGLNQLLENIFDTYKYSKYCLLSNLTRAFNITFFNYDIKNLKRTSFYKNNYKLVDKIIKENY